MHNGYYRLTRSDGNLLLKDVAHGKRKSIKRTAQGAAPGWRAIMDVRIQSAEPRFGGVFLFCLVLMPAVSHSGGLATA